MNKSNKIRKPQSRIQKRSNNGRFMTLEEKIARTIYNKAGRAIKKLAEK
jgi:hypothetical protein